MALPVRDDPRAVRAEARRHGEQVRWLIDYLLPPSSEPPQIIRDLDKKLDGPDGLASLLKRVALTSAPLSVDLRIFFELSAKEYSSELIPTSAVPPKVREYSPGAAIEHIGYRFRTAPLGIIELVATYDHHFDEYVIEVLAQATVTLAIERSVPLASTIAEHITETFFALAPQKENKI